MSGDHYEPSDIARTLVERREQVRELLGARYRGELREARAILRARMAQANEEILPSAMALATEAADLGDVICANLFFAAACEEIVELESGRPMP